MKTPIKPTSATELARNVARDRKKPAKERILATHDLGLRVQAWLDGGNVPWAKVAQILADRIARRLHPQTGYLLFSIEDARKITAENVMEVLMDSANRNT